MISRKSTAATATATAPKTQTPAPIAATTATAGVTRREVTHDQIARRAYEISQSATAGAPEENWYRAERELRARA